MRITGTVTTGRGAGGSYITRHGYRRQFQQHFDMQPYPGTLNLRLHGKNIRHFKTLREQPGVMLSGFYENGRHFGAVTCYPCTVENQVNGVVVIPEKSSYDDVMEIIARVCLRDTLGLQDGDRVAVTIPGR